jgi:glycosyltransferase involved in cell wall biosynthesis
MKDCRDLVSVIIPTYNHASGCKKAIESVLSQTHANVEIVVVDDGSKDNTRDVISGMDDRVKYIYQINAGVSAARNKALEAATGNYIAFLDSDDVWLPWKLEAQLSLLRVFPDVGMVWTDMMAVDENGRVLYDSYIKKMYTSYEYFNCERDFTEMRVLSEVWESCPAQYLQRKCYAGNIFSWMFMGNLVHTSTVLLHRERQRKVGLFDVDLIKSGEDYDYHFRTCRVGNVGYIDVPSIHYRIGAADQLTASKYMVWIARNNLKTIMKMLTAAKSEIHLPPRVMRKRLAQAHAWVGLAEFDENRRKARIHLAKSLTFSPLQKRALIFIFLSLLPRSIWEKLNRAWQKKERVA